MYALVQNNAFVRWVDLAAEYPNTSFPLPIKQADLPDGVVMVDVPVPPVTEPLQLPTLNAVPELFHDRWTLFYSVRDMTTDEASRETQSKAAQVRSERDTLLAASDWTQVADAPVDKTAWATYRQALRDITEQAQFPFVVQWPNSPA